MQDSLDKNQNQRLICIIIKETNNILLKFNEEETIENIKIELNSEGIEFHKFIPFEFDENFEVNSMNMENEINKNGLYDSFFPNDINEFIIEEILD